MVETIGVEHAATLGFHNGNSNAHPRERNSVGTR